MAAHRFSNDRMGIERLDTTTTPAPRVDTDGAGARMANRLSMTSAAKGSAVAQVRAGGLSAVGWIHLAVGAAMTLLIILVHPNEGDPLPFLFTADKLAAGGVAYRDITSEYPPLALVAMTLPRLLAGTSHAQYQTWFSVISIVLFAATF